MWYPRKSRTSLVPDFILRKANAKHSQIEITSLVPRDNPWSVFSCPDPLGLAWRCLLCASLRVSQVNFECGRSFKKEFGQQRWAWHKTTALTRLGNRYQPTSPMLGATQTSLQISSTSFEISYDSLSTGRPK